MNIYEIDSAILACVDSETGEVIDVEKLAELQLAREAKVEGIACWIKNLTANAESIRDEERRLAERRRAMENKVEGLKKYLADALGGQSFETAKCRLSFRSSAAVSVDDEEALIGWLTKNYRDDCLKYSASVDKKAVGQILANGEKVDGAHIETRSNLQIK